MRVLITGGAGYAGYELVMNLAQNKLVEEIIIYDNLSRKNYNLFITNKIKNNKINLVRGELLDSRNLKKVLQGIDVVYHLAAKVTTPFSSEEPQLFEQVNHWGTAELVYAVENSDVKRFIYLSSSSVYGETDNIADYNTIPNPKTFYGISKLRGEEHVKRLSDKIDTYILRCGNIFGYSPGMRFDAVINRFMFEANFTNRISIMGNGNQYRAFIHIDKVANVLSGLINAELYSGIYDLVDRNLNILEIAQTIKEIYPDMEMIFVNQHLSLRELKVNKDPRLKNLYSIPDKSFIDELKEFKEKFAF
ncbi:MAG: SDR family oxidoreductase [Bacteroidota bacterium]|nr:SDR family oxidoreductase [Bacteroidota bacterium]